MTVVFFLSHAWPNRNTVSRILLELFLNSVLDSVSCTKKNYQNKNTGRHRDSGQNRAKLVLGQSFKYFVPSFDTKHTAKLLSDLLLCRIRFVRLLDRQFVWSCLRCRFHESR